jgi:myo-inositol-1-phosphate synthase
MACGARAGGPLDLARAQALTFRRVSQQPQEPLGVWLVGGRGAVAVTTMVGTAALVDGAAAPTGLVTAAPPLDALPLAPLGALRFGGHDPSTVPLGDAALALCRERGPLERELVRAPAVAAALAAAESHIRPAPRRAADAPARAFVDEVRRDLAAFAAAVGARRVVVVNLATTEPPPAPSPLFDDAGALEAALDGPALPLETLLPTSTLYAYAALAARCPYVNFTPSLGAAAPALEALARERGVPHAGRDGKTGETLLKSALAPLFRMRQLAVQSWTGFNVLGNSDGRALAQPEVAASKVASKSGVVPAILGYQPHALVRIDYVPPLGDWKTAWDLIQFQGFLGTPMSLQLTWQGSDSALAAPLVLDLVRLVDLAARRGERGALGHLGFFFKSPLGSDVHDLASQWTRLVEHTCA